MTPAATDLLESLRDAGFEVTSRDDLVYVRPREKLSPIDVELVKANRVGLLNLLASERMIRCPGVCGAMVDPQSVEPLAAICNQFPCPFRDEAERNYERKPR